MVETNIIEIEIEKWNSFNKFGKFIDLTACYHLKRCQHNNCGNYTFVNKITDIYIEIEKGQPLGFLIVEHEKLKFQHVPH